MKRDTDMRTDSRLGRALRVAVAADRRALDLTQEEAGMLAGVSQTTVSRWESGEWAVSADYVAALAEAGGEHALRAMCEGAGRELGAAVRRREVSAAERREAACALAQAAAQVSAAALAGDWAAAGRAAAQAAEAAGVVAVAGVTQAAGVAS